LKSIRAKLALWLGLALCIGIIAALIATYLLVRQQIGHTFDAELALVAKAVHLREDWVREGRARLARPGFFFAVRAYDRTGRVYFETRLPEIPSEIPITLHEGYAYAVGEGEQWRLYTYVSDEGNVQVAQPVATRDALARDITLRTLAPMLLLIPILGALLPWALHRGLLPLRDISRRVSARDAMRLDPLPTEDVPEELLPLITQINGLLARLAASLDAQRAFLADAAHDLRSPIAALSLQAQIAERAPRDSARIAAFSELRRGIDRASRLVEQLLHFARLEPGVHTQPPFSVNVADMVRKVVGEYSAQADRRGVDLGAETTTEATIVGVEDELSSMLANLVDNALRYAPGGSEVTVSARHVDSEVLVSVIDAGPGIPACERSRVFDRFHRIPGDNRSNSGLGLSIVRAIVERHRGTISLSDAEPGAPHPGLRVDIHLPAA
jgi:two-component system OmpR family sensor kinase